MAVLSTFELLLKPQLPKSITSARPELAPLARTILQGYFLTIANLSDDLVFLSLVVTTRTPSLEKQKVLATLDTVGTNGPISLVDDTPSGPGSGAGATRRTRYSIPLNGKDTGLVVLQPNALDADLRTANDFELRGFSELSLSSSSTAKSVQLLVTAEHRGTFFGAGGPASLGELAYALPLATGGSLIELVRP